MCPVRSFQGVVTSSHSRYAFVFSGQTPSVVTGMRSSRHRSAKSKKYARASSSSSAAEATPISEEKISESPTAGASCPGSVSVAAGIFSSGFASGAGASSCMVSGVCCV